VVNRRLWLVFTKRVYRLGKPAFFMVIDLGVLRDLCGATRVTAFTGYGGGIALICGLAGGTAIIRVFRDRASTKLVLALVIIFVSH
jgi:hypothetical protein